MPDRRTVLQNAARIGAAATVGGLAVRGGWQALAPQRADAATGLGRELRIGYLPITDATALLIAHDRGLWAEAGAPTAKPVLFRSWDALAQAFVVGEVDVVHLLMPLALQLRLATNAPVKVLGWGHTNGSALVLGAGISDVGQLSGATVAVPYWWSVHSILTQRILTSAGLTPVIGRGARPGEVQLVVMAPAEMVSALAAGQIAGFAVADPFNAAAEIQGIGTVHRLLGDVWRDHACCAVAVRQDLIDRHPDTVHALADGLVAAQGWTDAHRDEAAERLSAGGYLPQPVGAIKRALSRPADPGAEHAHWHGEKLGFSAFPHAAYTERLVQLMAGTAVDGDRSFLDQVDPAEAHRQLVEDTFITAALQRAGVAVPDRVEEVSE